MLLRNVTFMTRDPERLADFWAAALGLPGRKTMTDEVLLHDGDWGHPRLTFQQLAADAPRRSPSPVHLDLTPVDGEDRQTAVARLVALGATEGDTHGDGSFRWTVVRDPDGNELCVTD